MPDENPSVAIHLPPISDGQVSHDLVWLTEQLAKSGAADEYVGGILGGEFGYGVDYENDTFMMHPFCWCDSDACPWCWGCECPDSAWSYTVAGGTVSHDEFLAAYDDPSLRHDRQIVRHPEHFCDYCRGERESAPNFLHKPSGTRVHWYKYIGRGMEVDLKADWRDVLADCVKSVSG